MKTVSPFEYAIMQEVNRRFPNQVTNEELAKIRPETDDEINKAKKDKIEDFFKRIKVKPESSL